MRIFQDADIIIILKLSSLNTDKPKYNLNIIVLSSLLNIIVPESQNSPQESKMILRRKSEACKRVLKD